MNNPSFLIFDSHNGVPHPRWKEFSEGVAALNGSAAQDAWRSAAEAWLTTLAAALTKVTFVYASRRLLLLGSPETEALVSSAERTILHIDRLLDGLGSVERIGPHVIVVLDTLRRFYDYVDYFHEEGGEYGGAAGIFVRGGYPHIVVGPGEPWSRRSVIAHELTHDYLSGRELPLWIEEGLAQLVQEHAANTPMLLLNREQRQRHQIHWSARGLDAFWSGEAFWMADDSQELGYQLALVLMRSIISDAGKRAAVFVRSAHHGDAGEQAAREVLGRSLADYVGAFIGAGDWTTWFDQR